MYLCMVEALRRTRLILLVLLLVGLYGLSKTPFLSGKDSLSILAHSVATVACVTAAKCAKIWILFFWFLSPLVPPGMCVHAIAQSHPPAPSPECLLSVNFNLTIPDSAIPNHIRIWLGGGPGPDEECDLWARQRCGGGQEWASGGGGVPEEPPEVHCSRGKAAQRQVDKC